MAHMDLTNKNFDSIIGNGVTLVDFWADWCGPCKMQAPVIDELGEKYEGKVTVAKLNVDDEPSIAARFGVMSIPTLIVFRDGKEIDLTEREYNIIHLMAAEPGKVFTREELMREVWQYDYYGDLRTVDVAMRRFREKLEKNPAEPEYIITRRGAGYYFSD